MPDPLVIQVMHQFKLDLLAREQLQMREMASEWLKLERGLESQIQAMADSLAREKAAGKAISQSKLWRMRRYQSLQAQLQQELAIYTEYANGLIVQNQAQYGALGIQHATTATQVSQPGVGIYFDVLPVEAIENMVGLAGDGSPLTKLLKTTWGDSAAGLTNELIKSTALGINPRETARRMQQGMSQGLNRMLNIARTEQLRVYREASRQQYQHSGVVEGFKRLATHDDRVCPACLMAEGEIYSVKQHLREHPSGRCTMVPIVTGMPKVSWELGQDWFKRQPAGTQQSILGMKKWRAWQDDKFDLDQLVTVKRNAIWGDSVQPTPLKDLIH
jgi:SPP1 gp7 family putative phage head morphogenesis protein